MTTTPPKPHFKRGDVIVVMTDNLATILETEINRVIGSLTMKPIDTALRHTLGF